MRRLAVLVTLVLVAGGCGSDAEPAADRDPTTTTVTTTTTTAPSTSTTTTTTTTSLPVPPGANWPEPPGPDWPVTTLTDAGIDEGAFEAAVALAEEVDSNCLVVLHNGAIAFEQYWNDWTRDDDQSVFSSTKSVAAVIVGIAADQGHLDIDEPASNYLTEWQDTASEDVTIRSLLQNTSGRYYDFENDFVTFPSAPDRSAFAVGLEQQSDPDTVWIYNNSAIQTLEEVVERATGVDVGEFAETHLFSRIGMGVTMARDESGNPGFYSGLQAGCLDMARFAILSQRLGTWGDEQIVSDGFMADATSPRTALNEAYGYLYWINSDGRWDHTDPRRDRSKPFWPDVPLDAFGAFGLGDQITMVLPSHDLVVVRLGPPSGSQGRQGVLANDLPGLVVDALEG